MIYLYLSAVIIWTSVVDRMTKQESEGKRATPHDTVDAIVGASGREAFPLRRAFLQQKRDGETRPGPLARFVSAGDRTGLLLYFLALTKASQAPWDVSLHSAVWARALDLPFPDTATARGRVSKAWSRLSDRDLVMRTRQGRLAKFTLLREDGSAFPYTRPTRAFVNVPHNFWTHGPAPSRRWYQLLTLPELAFLVIALSNLDDFSLPVERGPDYYGVSADTLLRGYGGLQNHGLLVVRRSTFTAPLSPTGLSSENRYTLEPPFGPVGRASRARSRAQ